MQRHEQPPNKTVTDVIAALTSPGSVAVIEATPAGPLVWAVEFDWHETSGDSAIAVPWTIRLYDHDLPAQFAGEQALLDHRVHAAHDIDDLRHAKAGRDAAERIGVM